jgi:hypothetical protein
MCKNRKMASLLDRARRATTLLLAAFLWLHALFFLPVQPTLIAKCARVLRLAPSEAVLFALLVIFSFLAASGFWKTVGSIAYIYGFPFVLLGYTFWWGFRLMRATNRWLMARSPSPPIVRSLVIARNAAPIVPVAASGARTPVTSRTTAAEILQFLLRPFRRFMLLWCILLLVTTHTAVVWLCLIVVLAQLARQIFIILKLLVFSPWLGEAFTRIGPALLTPLNNALVGLAKVTRDATPTKELRDLLNQVNVWRTFVDFLKDPYLLSRWAWILTIVFLATVYAYIASLFSFAYYGIARVSGVPCSWPDVFVTSIFFPFFFRDLPRALGVRVLSGLHCVLLVGVGIGTIMNFLRRKLDDIRTAAMEASNRFTEQPVHEKYIILEEMFRTSAAPASAGEKSKEATASDS